MSWRRERVLVMLVCHLATSRSQYYEGDACTTSSGGTGACAAFSRCPAAAEIIKTGSSPKTCSFVGRDPIICCPAPATPRPAAEYEPTEADYVDLSGPSECPPIPPDRTGTKNGRKAWDKCIEYQELVYPCVSSAGLSLGDDRVRADHCAHNAAELVVGGVDTREREFPHAVMLGYGNSPEWGCGGTLVSEWFVVTAGHCTFSREFGEVKFVRTSALRRSSPVDKTRIYIVGSIVKHPGYRAPSKYNDIALLRTQTQIYVVGGIVRYPGHMAPSKYNDIALLRSQTQMRLDQAAVPACLDVGLNPPGYKALAVGWGATQYKGANADVLQKVVLEKFSTDECRDKFPPGERNMREGFQEASQLCYGDHELSRDTCQGDSGGPLQTYNLRVRCMYWLIGITSFGKGCGFAGSPGVYTRVANFTPWIESVVWP